MSRPKKAQEGPVVLVDGAISDGKGGYLPKGCLITARPEAIADLKAKGLVG